LKTLEVLAELEGKKELSLFEKVLAVTNGSVTQLLETYLGGEVKLKTISQDIKMAGSDMSEKLDIKADDMVNFRVVEICGPDGKALIRAMSFIPLKRLEKEFEDDLMQEDLPIGKLFIKHGIEARRELLDVDVVGDTIKRVYNIIRGGEILMRIEEEFEAGGFR